MVKYLDQIQDKKFRKEIDQCIGIISWKNYPNKYESLYKYLLQNLEKIDLCLKENKGHILLNKLTLLFMKTLKCVYKV